MYLFNSRSHRWLVNPKEFCLYFLTKYFYNYTSYVVVILTTNKSALMELFRFKRTKLKYFESSSGGSSESGVESKSQRV